MLNRSTSVEHIAFSPACANEMLAAVFKVMAKRYYSYEDLKDVSGKFKPGGTLGSHFCTVTPMPYCIWVTPMDADTGGVFLKPGDTLGYDCGNVWQLPNPATIKNPIKRWGAENKCRVEWVDKLQDAAKPYLDDLHGTYNDRGRALYFTGTQIVAGDENCFVVVRSVKHMNGTIGKYWHRLVVKKGANVKNVAEVLSGLPDVPGLHLGLLDWIGFGRPVNSR